MDEQELPPRPVTWWPIQEGFKPVLADIIVQWGALESALDLVNDVLVEDPRCANVARSTKQNFKARAANFDKLCFAYFEEGAPEFRRFLARTTTSIREQTKPHRDRVAHGRYGARLDGHLTVSLLRADGLDMVVYSVEQLSSLLHLIAHHLFVAGLLSTDSITASDLPICLERHMPVPRSQLPETCRLIESLQARCEAENLRRMHSNWPPSNPADLQANL